MVFFRSAKGHSHHQTYFYFKYSKFIPWPNIKQFVQVQVIKNTKDKCTHISVFKVYWLAYSYVKTFA